MNPNPIKTDTNKKELLSISQAAKLCGLSRNNLAYFIKYYKLPVVKLPDYNRFKIHYSDLLDFINNYKQVHK